MDGMEIVKAYFDALDSTNMEQVEQYLSEDYQLIDFTQKPMSKEAMLEMLSLFKHALPDLKHSLSNIRIENNIVKLTVQLSGTSSKNLDLRKLGIGVVPSSKKFIIFPNATYEFTIQDDKILMQRDVSPISQNRRMPGMLKAMGVSPSVL